MHQTRAAALIIALMTGRHANKELSHAFGWHRVAAYRICDQSRGRGGPACWRLGQRQATPQGEHLPPVIVTAQAAPIGEVPGPPCTLILNLNAMEVPGSLFTLQADWLLV